MSQDRYLLQSGAAWVTFIEKLFPFGVPSTATWTDIESIFPVLKLVCSEQNSHGYLPKGGGMDFVDISMNRLDSLLAIQPHKTAEYVVRPKTLEFGDVDGSRVDSFFLLTLRTMAPLRPSDWTLRTGYEELLRDAHGNYHARACLDHGSLGNDEDGNEIPLSGREVVETRFLSGKILLVAKGSLWNQVPETYDARHNRLSVNEIRNHIGKGVAGLKKELSKMQLPAADHHKLVT